MTGPVHGRRRRIVTLQHTDLHVNQAHWWLCVQWFSCHEYVFLKFHFYIDIMQIFYSTWLQYVAATKATTVCLMPSTHGPIFCRKELWEKVRVKVKFFIRVSQGTRTDFLSQTKQPTNLKIFYGSVICRKHGLIFYQSYCVWQWQTRSHCWITSLRFFIGLKSVHTDRFFGVNSSEKKSDLFFIGTDFQSNFSGPCALGISGSLLILYLPCYHM